MKIPQLCGKASVEFLLYAIVLLGPIPALAVTWTADLGTTGVGLHADLPIVPSERVHARVGLNYLQRYKFSRTTKQVTYDFTASLLTYDALLDWYPTGSGFRLTAGVIRNNNLVDATGTPNRIETFTFENGRFSTTAIGKLSGRIDFQPTAPYLGIGWQGHHPNFPNWQLSTDLGVMYQGASRTKLGISGCTLPGMACDLLVNLLAPSIAAEEVRLNQQLKDYRYFPIFRIAIGYQF